MYCSVKEKEAKGSSSCNKNRKIQSIHTERLFIYIYVLEKETWEGTSRQANKKKVDVICTANYRTFICLFALPTFTFVSEVHLFVYSHGKLTDRALICLYARQILTDNPLINVKCICLLICTSKMRIGKYVLYFIHKNKVFTVNLDFRVDLSKYASVLCKFNIKKIYLKKYS